MRSAFTYFQLLALLSLLSHCGHIGDVSPLGQEMSATVDPIVSVKQIRTRGAPSHLQQISHVVHFWPNPVNVLTLMPGRGKGGHHDWLNPIVVNPGAKNHWLIPIMTNPLPRWGPRGELLNKVRGYISWKELGGSAASQRSMALEPF